MKVSTEKEKKKQMQHLAFRPKCDEAHELYKMARERDCIWSANMILNWCVEEAFGKWKRKYLK